MRKSLNYIEKHISGKLSVEDISGYVGYSEYHFSRIFKEFMGVSVMEYVKKRKLIFASEEILRGRKIIEVAVDCGYDSHSGFTRAFCREFGFYPALLKAITIHLEGGNGMEHVFMEKAGLHMSKEELLAKVKTAVLENGISLEEGQIDAMYKKAVSAYEGMKRYSGEEYVTHPLHVALILACMEAEPDCILAGMMCDVLKKTDTDLEKLCLPTQVKTLVLGTNREIEGSQEQTDKKVVLIKMAERLHNMRTIEFMDEESRRKKAVETLELFLPVAAKLGNEKLTAELNDLALKCLA